VSAHGVAGPRSALSGPATRGGTDQLAEATEPSSPASPTPETPERPTRPDHLRVVPRGQLSARQRRRRTRFAVMATGLFVVAVLFGLVGLHVMLAQNQFRLDRLNGQADAEQARYERLRLQLDQLESPKRIISTAQQKLGMVTPSSVTYLTPSAPLPASASSSTSGSSATGAAGADGAAGMPAAVSPPDWTIVKPHLAAQP
jgi:cell division protein FtsL